jgi:antitoxin component of RelBE/YafQ-DinJ toxin-antitoxin module
MNPQGPAKGPRRLLTFRLDQEQRQRLRARLAREGRTMSEVVTHGLRQYVQHARHRDGLPGVDGQGAGGRRRAGAGVAAAAAAGAWARAGRVAPVLPERVAARLRELRSSGRSELLSATLAALTEAGWPLRSLAEALGISRQAVQARVRRLTPAALRDAAVPCEPPPPFPQRRMASAAGLRPHLTIKIDHTLRASAHRAAADEGSSLTQVVEAILDRYLRHGMASEDKAGYSRQRTRIIRQAPGASTGRSVSKSP